MIRETSRVIACERGSRQRSRYGPSPPRFGFATGRNSHAEIPKRKTLALQRVGRIKERSDADPAMVLARRRNVAPSRIGASRDSAYFEMPGRPYSHTRTMAGQENSNPTASPFTLVTLLLRSCYPME